MSTMSELQTYVLHLTPDEFEALTEAVSRKLQVIPKSRSETIIRVQQELKHLRPKSADELASYADDVKRRAYFEEVHSMAEEIEAELLEGELSLDDWSDSLHERVDSSGLVIYTASAIDVLRYSENDGYSIENFGAETAVQDGCLNWSALAFGALYADVMEAVDTASIEETLLERVEDSEQFLADMEEHVDSFGCALLEDGSWIVDLEDARFRMFPESDTWETPSDTGTYADLPEDRYWEIPEAVREAFLTYAKEVSRLGE